MPINANKIVILNQPPKDTPGPVKKERPKLPEPKDKHILVDEDKHLMTLRDSQYVRDMLNINRTQE